MVEFNAAFVQCLDYDAIFITNAIIEGYSELKFDPLTMACAQDEIFGRGRTYSKSEELVRGQVHKIDESLEDK